MQKKLIGNLDRLQVSVGSEGISFLKDQTILGSHLEEEISLSSDIEKLNFFAKIGIAQVVEDGFFISNDGLYELERLEQEEGAAFPALEELLPWSSLLLRVGEKGMIGFKGFELQSHFADSKKKTVKSELIGSFLVVGDKTFRLPAHVREIQDLIREFNQLPGEQKEDKRTALQYIHQIRCRVSKGGVELSRVLASTETVVPDKLKLGISVEGEEVSFYPIIDGVEEAELKKNFLALNNGQEVYDLTRSEGGRVRVVLPEKSLQSIKNIRRHGTRLRGAKKDEVLRNPSLLIAEGDDAGSECFDLSELGPRVRGIGLYAAVARPVLKTKKEEWIPEEIGLKLDYVNGQSEMLNFASAIEAREFLSRAEEAQEKGQSSIDMQGRNIPVDASLIERMRNVVEVLETKSKVDPKSMRERNILLIYENEAQVDYGPTVEGFQSKGSSPALKFVAPRSLKQNIDLKGHQRIGVAWIQALLLHQSHSGCLLADDMGLGKTLQILTALAWSIESERFKDSLGADVGPYQPILIVAPLTLVPVWRNEIERFFDQTIFLPILELHGKEIQRLKRADTEGAELDLARPVLRVEELTRYRIIITNYETVRNYQHSLARLPLSILVLDEAQEIKEPGSIVTLAAKALNAQFRIASTGTPVENNLLNLWSIIDFLQPGATLVGAQKDFLKQFNGEESDRQERANELKEKLGLNKNLGHVRRRLKSEVLQALPAKTTHRLEVSLSAEQKSHYLAVIQAVRSGDKKKEMLRGLQTLSLISQHPFLKDRELHATDHRTYLEVCPKLQKLVEILANIRMANEKALVFATSIPMQHILEKVIRGAFGLDVDIMNGETRSNIRYSAKSRMSMIENFSKTDGFNVIILSPEVAGVGLTITAANHVIHYGRWWNPAKENQATDRAYRIGQSRAVHVYYLIAVDSKGEFESFDLKLDRLLRDKEELAKDFLTPSFQEQECSEELLKGIFSSVDAALEENDRSISFEDLADLDFSQFEAAVAMVLRDQYEHVILTPKSSDRGVDVIALNGKSITLVQIKHTASPKFEISRDPIPELFDGLHYFRDRLIGTEVRGWEWKLMAVSNGVFDGQIRKNAEHPGVQLLDGQEFRKIWTLRKRLRTELMEAERNRSDSLSHVEKVLKLVTNVG